MKQPESLLQKLLNLQINKMLFGVRIFHQIITNIENCKKVPEMFGSTVDGSQRETKWFFERARGQYFDEVSRRETGARKKQFELEYPKDQKFDKGDLAELGNLVTASRRCEPGRKISSHIYFRYR